MKRRTAALLALFALLSLLAFPAAVRAAETRERGVSIGLGDSASSAVSPAGDEDDFFVDGAAGTKATFCVSAEDAALVPALALLTPEGAWIAAPPAEDGETALALTLPATGRYVLRVAGADGSQGAYRLATRGKAPASVRPPAVELRPGATAEFRFAAFARSVVSVRFAAPKGADFRVLEVLDPRGEAVAGALDAFGPGRAARKASFPVFSGFGEYAIRIGGASAATTVSFAAKVSTPKATRAILAVPAGEPRPASVEPAAAQPGAWVTIRGTGFPPDGAVYFGDVKAPLVRLESAEEIGARVPSTAPRRVPLEVSVRGPEGQENGLPCAFTILTPPVLVSATPALAKPGDEVALTGSGFLPGAAVFFGATLSPAVSVAGDSLALATVPAGYPDGPCDILLRNPDGLMAKLADAVTVESPAVLSGVDPAAAERGDPVRVRGAGFREGTVAEFAGVPAETTFLSPEELLATVPSIGLADGSTDVSVRKPFGTGTTLPDGFFVFASPEWQGLVLTGVIDGPRSGGKPKAVELRATADLADLAVFALRLASNGGTFGAATFTLSGRASKGQFLTVASETVEFEAYFGYAPDFTSGMINWNGNDAVGLFRDGVLVDVFGDPTQVKDANDFGAAWAFQDGFAVRRSATGPSTVFDVREWSVSGNDALDPQGASGTNGTGGITVPFGTWFWR